MVFEVSFTLLNCKVGALLCAVAESEEMDRVPAANGLSFRVGFTGHSGHLTVEPLPPVDRPNRLHDLPDFILVSIPSFYANQLI